MLRVLERRGTVVQVEPQRYYSTAALATVADRLRAGTVPGRVYSPAELRDVLGVSRKFLIPLLEHFDRTRVTDRHAEGRVIRGT
jgi:selenocysteine-specific elongation factor